MTANPFSKYLSAYAAAVAIIAVPVLANILFLRNSWEIKSYNDLVPRQLDRDVLFGPALMYDIWKYKLELVRQVKPDVVALGSSRMMQIQRDAFTSTFINAGGGMNSPAQGLQFVQQMVAFHKPKLLIVGVDSCWFTSKHYFPPDDHDQQEDVLTQFKLTQPYLWLLRHKLRWSTYRSVIFGRPFGNAYVNQETRGVLAIEKAEGFRSDGSRFYGSAYAGDPQMVVDVRFARTINLFEQRGWQFETGQSIDEERYQELRELIDICHRQGIALILIMTPPAQALYSRMRSAWGDYRFIDELTDRLSRPGQSFEFYNLMDTRTFGSNDCESVDGLHPGNVAYDRVLRYIVTTHPASALEPFVSRQKMDDLIDRFRGHALVVSDAKNVKVKENDFLQIGCQK